MYNFFKNSCLRFFCAPLYLSLSIEMPLPFSLRAVISRYIIISTAHYCCALTQCITDAHYCCAFPQRTSTVHYRCALPFSRYIIIFRHTIKWNYVPCQFIRRDVRIVVVLSLVSNCTHADRTLRTVLQAAAA